MSVLIIAVSAILYTCEKKTPFGKLNEKLKQAIIGIIFGSLACMATWYGVDIKGAVMNVRDAAPLCAGLLFGWPSGLIAGLIGGVHRYIAVIWGAGAYTQLACSIANILVGIVGAALRKFMFDNKKPTFAYGIGIAVIVEVFHMLMIFFTNMNDIGMAFTFVQKCTLPMILANAITVGATTFVVGLMGNKRVGHKGHQKELALSYQLWLLVCVVIAFIASSAFAAAVQKSVATVSSKGVIEITLSDIKGTIESGNLDAAVKFAPNCHIGQSGGVIISDESLTILTGKHKGEKLENTDIFGAKTKQKQDDVFLTEIYGKPSYCIYTLANRYFIIGYLPEYEAMFFKNVSTYVTVFVQMLIFAALFILIYFLTKKLVVDNITKINGTLAQITDGNLNAVVNVRSHKEFASLSDDINHTVSTLKAYIAEAAARIDKELLFAKQIQHSALPSVFPPYPSRKDFEIYAQMFTAKEVGGDFYDFYFVDKNKFAFLIADVSGKGIPAAMFMMSAKTTIKNLAESGMNVEDVLIMANNKLCESNEAGMFVTAWMGIIDLKTGIVRFVNAGHNPPLIKKSNGEFEYLKTRTCLVLAGMDGIKYRAEEFKMDKGDTIYLYTDGVTEATDSDNSLYGDDRLLSVLQATDNLPIDKLCDKVKNSVDIFVGNAPQFDDITMLAFKFKGGDNS